MRKPPSYSATPLLLTPEGITKKNALPAQTLDQKDAIVLS